MEDFDETCHKHSSFKWELLKMFSRSEVKVKVLRIQMCKCYNGGGREFLDTSSQSTHLGLSVSA